MTTLKDTQNYTWFIGGLASLGGCLACIGIYQTPWAAIAGAGLGLIFASGVGGAMGVYVTAKGDSQPQEEPTPEQQTDAQAQERPGAIDPTYAASLPAVFNPNETWLEIEPGYNVKVLLPQWVTDWVRYLVASGKRNMVHRDFIGKDKIFKYREAEYQDFLAELTNRGLASRTSGNVVRLNDYGVKGFTNPSPFVG